MTEHFGLGFDFDAVRADRVAWTFAHIERNGMPEKPGLRELLVWLRANGLKTAIATSSERRFVDFYMAHADLGHPFDTIVTGDRVTRSKPEPDIFLKAAEELGAAPADCVVWRTPITVSERPTPLGCVPSWSPICSRRPLRWSPSSTGGRTL